MGKNLQVPLDISLLCPSELTDDEGNYIDIWKQEAWDDNYLMNYFLETPAYKELCKTQKYIVSGRKGTGKTALRRAFIRNKIQENNTSVEDIDFSTLFTPSFFNGIQDLLMNENYSHEFSKSYIDKITWIIMIRWIVILLKDEESIISQTDKQILNEILELNGYLDLIDIGKKSLDLKKVKTTIEFNGRINLPKGFFEAKKTDSKEYDKETIDFDYLLPYIQKYIFDLLLTNGKKFFMLFDGIDKARIFTSPEIYSKIVQDFLLAIFRINEELFKLGNGSRIIVFIRNDILDLLEGGYDDMGKLRGDYRVKIDWQSNYKDEDSLLNQLIEARLCGGVNLRNPNNHYTKPLLNNVLKSSKITSKLYEETPQRFKDIYGEFSYEKFLCNRTLLRPRDYIQFFGILSKSKDMNNFDREYSEYFKSQTLDEIKKIVKDYSKTEKALELTCRGQGEFKGKYFINNYIGDSKNKGLQIEAENTLKLLYQYGVVGYIEETQFGDKMTRFFYRESDTRTFNPETCILHAGLYKAYGVV